MPLLLYDQLSALTVPQKLVNPLLAGTPVIIYNADGTTIIAHGHLSAPDVHPPMYENVKLTASHVLVEILKVHVLGAIINSHKKSALKSFGTVPFRLVCLRSCVHLYDPLRTQMPALSSELGPESTELAPTSDSEATNNSNYSIDEDIEDGTGSLMQETGEISGRIPAHLSPDDHDT